MDGFDMLGAGALDFGKAASSGTEKANAPAPAPVEGASWFKRPVLGPVPGWGVAAGASGLTALLLFIVLGK